jgi:hypothetical protein
MWIAPHANEGVRQVLYSTHCITDAYHFLKHGATDDQQETKKQDCGSNEPSRPRGERREQKAVTEIS